MTLAANVPTDLSHDYPLPWTSVADPACARIVAANGATVLACDPSEANIAAFLAGVVSGVAPLQHAITGLTTVLAGLDGYPTSDDFVDDLIVAAEAVIAIA